MAITLLVAGLALVATGGALDATARDTGNGIVVPAFHTTTPAVPYTPVCSATRRCRSASTPPTTAATRCSVLASLIDPVVAPVQGVPGMPVRAKQFAASGLGVRGDPPVLPFGNFIVHGDAPCSRPRPHSSSQTGIALSLFSHSRTQHDTTRAQGTIALYDLRQAGVTPTATLTGDPAATAAATASPHCRHGPRHLAGHPPGRAPRRPRHRRGHPMNRLLICTCAAAASP